MKIEEFEIFNEVRAIFTFNEKSFSLFSLLNSHCQITGNAVLYIAPTTTLVKECFLNYCKVNNIVPSSSELIHLSLKDKENIIFSDLENLKYRILKARIKQIHFYDGLSDIYF